MYSLYGFLFEHHIVINIALVILLLFSIWILLNEKCKQNVFSLFKRTYKENQLKDQLVLLGSIVAISIFTYGSLGDYWLGTIILLTVVCILQVIGLVLLFVKTKEKDEHVKRTAIIGVVSLILEFTNIYCIIYLYDWAFSHYLTFFVEDSFNGVINHSSFMMWTEFLFYTVSLILPYPLTVIQAVTNLPKVISLFQIGIFYLLIFNKVSEIFMQNRKESISLSRGDNESDFRSKIEYICTYMRELDSDTNKKNTEQTSVRFQDLADKVDEITGSLAYHIDVLKGIIEQNLREADFENRLEDVQNNLTGLVNDVAEIKSNVCEGLGTSIAEDINDIKKNVDSIKAATEEIHSYVCDRYS